MVTSNSFRDQYYDDLSNFYRYHLNGSKKILEINHKPDEILKRLFPDNNVYTCEIYDNKRIHANGIYEYIIVPDTLTSVYDIQQLFRQMHALCDEDTRLVINYHNFFWQPFLKMAEILKLKEVQAHYNWLGKNDIVNLLQLEGFDVVNTGKRLLFPIYIPVFSDLLNKYIARLPIINNLCLIEYIIARPTFFPIKDKSVSVVVAARNETGNIENLIKRVPDMGKATEIIFIEGGSKDETWNEIVRVAKKYGSKTILYAKQDGKGKADAVRKGFSMANGDILMILDADLTVPPEDLPKFYDAIASGKGEYINGSRLVYPMENEAMQFLNMIANKFFSVVFSWLLDQQIKDTLCGTKVISKKNYVKLARNRTYFGDFDPFGDFDLLFGSSKLNLKFVEIPIRYKARVYGSTNISRFKHGVLLLKMVAFALNKIKFF